MRNQAQTDPPPKQPNDENGVLEEAKAIHSEVSEGGDQLEEAALKEAQDKTLTLINERSSEVENGDRIKDVWLNNFFTEMEKVSSLVDEYSYISMVSPSCPILIILFLYLRIRSTQELSTFHQIPRTNLNIR